jgi:competence ComEA-like helix-hairpin-helix protein
MLPLTLHERRALLFVSSLLLLGLALTFLKKTTGCNVCLIDIYGNKKPRALDINAATRDELSDLPGIGAQGADNIVAWRSARGGFKDTKELRGVPGVTEKMLDVSKQYLYIK